MQYYVHPCDILGPHDDNWEEYSLVGCSVHVVW